MADGYTIYGSEILTNIDFADTSDLLTKNASIAVADNELTVTDESDDEYGELTVVSTGVWSASYYTIDVEEGQIYKFDISVFSIGSADELNGAITIHDGDFAENIGFRQFKNKAGQDVWGQSTFLFKAPSDSITIALGAVTAAIFNRPSLKKIVFTTLPKNTMLDLFDGESTDNIVTETYFDLSATPSIISTTVDITDKYIELDYDVIINDDDNNITVRTGVVTTELIPNFIGRHLARLDFTHNELSIISNDASIIIHSVRIIDKFGFMIEVGFIPSVSSDDVTASQPIITLDNTDTGIIDIQYFAGAGTFFKTLDTLLGCNWLVDSTVYIRVIYGKKGSMLSTEGTAQEFPNDTSDERRYQIGYSVDNKLTFMYTPSSLFIDNHISILNNLRLTNGTPNFDISFINLSLHKETSINNFDILYTFNFENEQIHYNDEFFEQNADGTYTFTSDGLLVETTETDIPTINFNNRDSNIINNNNFINTDNIETFNSILTVSDNKLQISPNGDITGTYSSGYFILDTVPGLEYNIMCVMSVSNDLSENRIFISDDFALKDTGRESTALIVSADTDITKQLTFTAYTTKTIVRFSTSNSNITYVSGLRITGTSFVNSVVDVLLHPYFERFTAVGNSNNADLAIDGNGNLEINGDSYAYFEVDTLIGYDYTVTTQINMEDIDSGNILHGKLLALDGINVLELSDEILSRDTLINTTLIFTAVGLTTRIAFHPGRNINIICAPVSIKQSEYILYTTNVSQSGVPTLNRKFEYVFQTIIPEFLQQKNPIFVNYMKMFGIFLDDTYGDLIYGLIDLYNVENADERFLDSLLNQYFKDVFDENTLIINEVTRRVFISLSKLILNSKLTKVSLDFLFTNLRNFQYIDSLGNTISIDKLTSTYLENEDWWTPTEQWFIDNPTVTPYEVYEQGATTRPFTYQFTLDSTQDAINKLLETVHPVGYLIEFLQQYDFSESCNVTEEVIMTASIFNYYDGAVEYNGIIPYSGSNTVPINEDSLIK